MDERRRIGQASSRRSSSPARGRPIPNDGTPTAPFSHLFLDARRRRRGAGQRSSRQPALLRPGAALRPIGRRSPAEQIESRSNDPRLRRPRLARMRRRHAVRPPRRPMPGTFGDRASDRDGGATMTTPIQARSALLPPRPVRHRRGATTGRILTGPTSSCSSSTTSAPSDLGGRRQSHYYLTPHTDRARRRRHDVHERLRRATHAACPSRYAIITRTQSRPATATPARGEKLDGDRDHRRPGAMKDGGYATYFLGKWHLGGERRGHRPDRAGRLRRQCRRRPWRGTRKLHLPLHPFDEQAREEAPTPTRAGDMPGLEKGTVGEQLTDRLTDRGGHAATRSCGHVKTRSETPFLSSNCRTTASTRPSRTRRTA